MTDTITKYYVCPICKDRLVLTTDKLMRADYIFAQIKLRHIATHQLEYVFHKLTGK